MAARKPAKKPVLDMAAIVAATQQNSFVYTSVEAHKEAREAGLVEVNDSMKNDAGELATRATQKGIDSMSQNSGTPAAEAAPSSKPTYAIEDGVALAPVTGRGRGGGETYPFDALKVGQSFFVPNTADKPEVHKSLASTVSSATKRYAEEIEGQTRKDRKGNTVPALKFNRKFVLRKVEGGARIWRTE